MSVFAVIDKATGQERYRYDAPQAIEWNGFEFSTHDHVAQPDVPAPDAQPTGRVMTKLEYLRRFTQDERIAIRAVAAQSPVLDDYLRLLELAEEINTADADTIAAVHMLEQAGLIVAGRAEEILNG